MSFAPQHAHARASSTMMTTSSSSPLLLKPIEIQYFDRLFLDLDPTMSGFLSGQSVKNLFTSSRLAKSQLAEIWKCSDRQKRKLLDKEDFYVACKLIAIAQQGLPVALNSIAAYPDVAIPVFDGIPVPQQQPQSQTQNPIMQQQLGLMARSQSTPQSQPQSQPLLLSQPPLQSQPPVSEWSMSETEKVQYLSSFISADLDGDGFVAGKEAQSFFKLSQLDNDTLKKIWRLSDQDRDNKLNPDEFAVAMHLVLKVRKRCTLPDALPEVLKIVRSTPFPVPAVVQPQPTQKRVSFDSPAGQSTAAPLDHPILPISSGFKSNDFEAAFTNGASNSPPQAASFNYPSNGSESDAIDLNSLSFSTSPPANRVSNNAAVASPPLFEAAVKSRSHSRTNSTVPQAAAVSALQSARREVDEQAKQQNVLSRMYSDSVQLLEENSAELDSLREKLDSYRTQKESLQEKLEANSKQLEALRKEIDDCKSEREMKREEILEFDEKVKESERELDATRKKLNSMRQEIKETQVKAADVERSIGPIKNQSEDVETEIAIVESQLNSMRSELKAKEDLKSGQQQILQTRRDQVARLLKEKAEVQAMLQASQDELAKIKNDAIRAKAALETHQNSISEMKLQLEEHREIVEEERKNPSLPEEIVMQSIKPVIAAVAVETKPVETHVPAPVSLPAVVPVAAVVDPIPAVAVVSPPPAVVVATVDPAKLASTIASIAALVDDDDDFKYDDIIIKDPFAAKPAAEVNALNSPKPTRISVTNGPLPPLSPTSSSRPFQSTQEVVVAAPAPAAVEPVAAAADPFGAAPSGASGRNSPAATSVFDDGNPFSDSAPFSADLKADADTAFGAASFDDDPFASSTAADNDVDAFAGEDPFAAAPKMSEAAKRNAKENLPARPSASQPAPPPLPPPMPPQLPPQVPVPAAHPAPAFEADFDDDPFASAPPVTAPGGVAAVSIQAKTDEPAAAAWDAF